MRNLVNFTRLLKNLKICLLRDFFVQGILYHAELKNYRRVMCHDKGDAKFKEKRTGGLKNDKRNVG